MANYGKLTLLNVKCSSSSVVVVLQPISIEFIFYTFMAVENEFLLDWMDTGRQPTDSQRGTERPSPSCSSETLAVHVGLRLSVRRTYARVNQFLC